MVWVIVWKVFNHKWKIVIIINVLIKKAYGKEHLDVSYPYENIGLVNITQGNYATALECLNKALTIREKSLGREHPAVADLCNNIGVVYYNQGDYAKALEFFNMALPIQEKYLGKEHPETKKTKEMIESIKEK